MNEYYKSFRDGKGILVGESSWTLKPLQTPEEEKADPFPVLNVEKTKHPTIYKFAFKGKHFRLESWEEENRDSTYVKQYSDGEYIFWYYPINSLLNISRIKDPIDIPYEALPYFFSTYMGQSFKDLVKTKEGIFSLWTVQCESVEGEGENRCFKIRVDYFRQTSTFIKVYPEKNYAIGSLAEWALEYEQITGEFPVFEMITELKLNNSNVYVPCKAAVIKRGIKEVMLKKDESRIPVNRLIYSIEQFETNAGVTDKDLIFTVPAGTKIHCLEKNIKYIIKRPVKTSSRLLRKR